MKYHNIKDPIRIYNELLGGKWRLLILYQLFQKTQRFRDLNLNIKGITPRMLTKELRSLEKYNLVEKEIYREVPPRVEYSLTDIGIKLYPLIENIILFGENFAYLTETEHQDLEKMRIDVEQEPFEFDQIIEEPADLNTTIIKSETISPPPPPADKAPKPKKPKDDDKRIIQLELF